MSKFTRQFFNVTGNPELSRLIQLKAFELGYRWRDGNDTEVRYLDMPFIFTSECGSLTYDTDNESTYGVTEGGLEFFQLEPAPPAPAVPSIREQIEASPFSNVAVGVVTPEGYKADVSEEELRGLIEQYGNGQSLEEILQVAIAENVAAMERAAA